MRGSKGNLQPPLTEPAVTAGVQNRKKLKKEMSELLVQQDPEDPRKSGTPNLAEFNKVSDKELEDEWLEYTSTDSSRDDEERARRRTSVFNDNKEDRSKPE